MKIEDLSPELQEKVKACNGGKELVELATSEGFELTEEDLDAIAGGANGWGPEEGRTFYCPKCHSEVEWAGIKRLYRCPKCNIDGLGLEDLLV